jgi:hypothetical protein
MKKESLSAAILKRLGFVMVAPPVPIPPQGISHQYGFSNDLFFT